MSFFKIYFRFSLRLFFSKFHMIYLFLFQPSLFCSFSFFSLLVPLLLSCLSSSPSFLTYSFNFSSLTSPSFRPTFFRFCFYLFFFVLPFSPLHPLAVFMLFLLFHVSISFIPSSLSPFLINSPPPPPSSRRSSNSLPPFFIQFPPSRGVFNFFDYFLFPPFRQYSSHFPAPFPPSFFFCRRP